MQKQPLRRPIRRPRQGVGIFGLVLLAVAAIMVIGGSLVYLSQRSASQLRVQRAGEAQADLQSNARQIAALLTDTDGDGALEPPVMTAGGGPVDGGLPPAGVGITVMDPYGTAYGYCAWDPGTTNASAGRLSGLKSGFQPAILFALISAGADKTFQTTCASLAAGGQAAGDDVVRTYSYATAASQLTYWQQDPATGTLSPSTAASPLAIGKAAATAGYVLDANGAIQATGLNDTGAATVAGAAALNGGTTTSSLTTGTATIGGGSINATTLGASSASSGAFTTVSASSVTAINAVTGQTLVSTTTTAAPLSVASSVAVVNLTSSYLGAAGQDAAFFTNSSNQSAGTLSAARLPAMSGDAVSAAGTGVFSVQALLGRPLLNAVPASGQALAWSGSAWTPTTLTAGAGGNVGLNTSGFLGASTLGDWCRWTGVITCDQVPPPYALSQLLDVTLTSPANGQILGYNGSKWVNEPATTALGYIPVNKAGDAMTGNLTITTPATALTVNDTAAAGAINYGIISNVAGGTNSNASTAVLGSCYQDNTFSFSVASSNANVCSGGYFQSVTGKGNAGLTSALFNGTNSNAITSFLAYNDGVSLWGLYTQGNTFANNYFTMGGAILQSNGDLYMPWAGGVWLSSYFSTQYAKYLPLAGGTMTGPLTVDSTIATAGGCLDIAHAAGATASTLCQSANGSTVGQSAYAGLASSTDPALSWLDGNGRNILTLTSQDSTNGSYLTIGTLRASSATGAAKGTAATIFNTTGCVSTGCDFDMESDGSGAFALYNGGRGTVISGNANTLYLDPDGNMKTPGGITAGTTTGSVAIYGSASAVNGRGAILSAVGSTSTANQTYGAIGLCYSSNGNYTFSVRTTCRGLLGTAMDGPASYGVGSQLMDTSANQLTYTILSYDDGGATSRYGTGYNASSPVSLWGLYTPAAAYANGGFYSDNGLYTYSSHIYDSANTGIQYDSYSGVHQFNSGATGAVNEVTFSPTAATFTIPATGPSFTSTSDARLKVWRGDLDGGRVLDQLRGLHLGRYEANRQGLSRGMTAGTHIGTLAQDIEARWPELVSTDSLGWKGVDYGGLSVVALAGLRDLDGREHALEARLDEALLESGTHTEAFWKYACLFLALCNIWLLWRRR